MKIAIAVLLNAAVLVQRVVASQEGAQPRAIVPIAAKGSFCEHGVKDLYDKGVCCDSQCGTCGGPNCGAFPGGPHKCCTDFILDSGKFCTNPTDTACVKPQAYFKMDTEGVACPAGSVVPSKDECQNQVGSSFSQGFHSSIVEPTWVSGCLVSRAGYVHWNSHVTGGNTRYRVCQQAQTVLPTTTTITTTTTTMTTTTTTTMTTATATTTTTTTTTTTMTLVGERCPYLSQGGGYEVTITAECAEGYHGEVTIEDCNGHWTQSEEPWNLTGCLPDHCRTPALDGYKITEERSLDIPDFHVDVKCADGFSGHPVALPCTAHDTEFTLSGCTPRTCSMPASSATVGYIIIETNLEVPDWDVAVGCDIDYRETDGLNKAPYAEPCNESGSPFRVFGCEPKTCRHPSQSAYEVSVTSLQMPDFKVEAECKHGYFGSAVVKRCAGHNQPYHLTNCHPAMCTRPDASTRPGYDIAETDLEIPHFQVSVSCKDGWHECSSSQRPKAVPCTADGSPYQLEGCCSDVCTLPPSNESTGYSYTVISLAKADFSVQVECAPGWTGPVDVDTCSRNGGHIHFAGCSQDMCTTPDLDGYSVTETNLARGNFSVQATCTENYLVDDDGAVATACARHGEPYNLAGCNPEVCSSPLATAGYDSQDIVEHSRNIVGFNVTVSQCAQFYTGNPKATVCNNHDSPYSLSGCQPTYYLTTTSCPEGEDITQPQECYTASVFLQLGEDMSTRGTVETDSFYAGCFEQAGDASVQFNRKENANVSGSIPGKMVCSRSPCAQALHYVIQSDHTSKDGGGEGYCTNNRDAKDCCQAWERILDYSECEQAGRSLSFNVSNMVGEECIDSLPPGCFYSETPGMDISAVRFNLPSTDDRSCGNYELAAWTVRTICQKIIAYERPGITLEDAGTISSGDPDG